MISKMSTAQEQKIIRGVEKAIALTRSGIDPDTALTKVARELGFTPPMTKRACEAFNKSKAVYVLSTLSSKDRAEAYDYVHADKVLPQVFKIEKAASQARLPSGDFSALEPASEPMNKVASMLAPKKTEAVKCTREEFLKQASDLQYRADLKKRMGYLDKFAKQRAAVQDARTEAEINLQKAAEQMRYMPDHELRKVAHNVVNKYGSVGSSAIKLLGSKLNKDLPTEKTTHGAILPYQAPYIAIDHAISSARDYVNQEKQLVKVAQEGGEHLFPKEGGWGYALTNPVFLATNHVMEALNRAHPKVNRDELLTPSFLNELRTIDNENLFTDVAAEDFISKYPLKDVTEAYDNIVNMVPSLATPQKKAALIALVKRQLAQGQLLDPTEIKEYTDLEEAMANTEKARTQAEDIRTSRVDQRVKDKKEKDLALNPEPWNKTVKGIGKPMLNGAKNIKDDTKEKVKDAKAVLDRSSLRTPDIIKSIAAHTFPLVGGGRP